MHLVQTQPIASYDVCDMEFVVSRASLTVECWCALIIDYNELSIRWFDMNGCYNDLYLWFYYLLYRDNFVLIVLKCVFNTVMSLLPFSGKIFCNDLAWIVSRKFQNSLNNKIVVSEQSISLIHFESRFDYYRYQYTRIIESMFENCASSWPELFVPGNYP